MADSSQKAILNEERTNAILPRQDKQYGILALPNQTISQKRPIMTMDPSSAITTLSSNKRPRGDYWTVTPSSLVEKEEQNEYLRFPPLKKSQRRYVRIAERLNVYHKPPSTGNVDRSSIWYSRQDLSRFSKATAQLAQHLREQEMRKNGRWSHTQLTAYHVFRQGKKQQRAANAILKRSQEILQPDCLPDDDMVGMGKYVFFYVAKDTAVRQQEMMREMHHAQVMMHRLLPVNDKNGQKELLLRNVVRRYSRVSRLFAQHCAQLVAASCRHDRS